MPFAYYAHSFREVGRFKRKDPTLREAAQESSALSLASPILQRRRSGRDRAQSTHGCVGIAFTGTYIDASARSSHPCTCLQCFRCRAAVFLTLAPFPRSPVQISPGDFGNWGCGTDEHLHSPVVSRHLDECWTRLTPRQRVYGPSIDVSVVTTPTHTNARFDVSRETAASGATLLAWPLCTCRGVQKLAGHWPRARHHQGTPALLVPHLPGLPGVSETAVHETSCLIADQDVAVWFLGLARFLYSWLPILRVDGFENMD